MTIIVAPFYNEEENIENFLRQFIPLKKILEIKRLVLVNDGSTDSSSRIVRRFLKKLPITLVNISPNQGPGNAFQEGIVTALKLAKRTDIVCTLESDMTSDLSILPMMKDKIKKGADVVLASCFAKGGGIEGVDFQREFLSWSVNTFLRFFFRIPGASTYSSFYRVYTTYILQKVLRTYDSFFSEKGFVCMTELLIRLYRVGANIDEVPMVLRWSARKGKSKMKVFKTIRSYLRILLRYGVGQ